MPNYIAYLTDTFGRTATTAGPAGSTTDVGNGWTDGPGIYNLDGTELHVAHGLLSLTGYNTGTLLRPTSETSLSQECIVKFKSGFHPGAGNQIAGVVLCQQVNGDGVLAYFTDTTVNVYTRIGGTLTSVLSPALNSSAVSQIQFVAKIDAPINGSRLISVSMFELLGGPTQVGTTQTVSTTAASLQTAGYGGLIAWTNGGAVSDVNIVSAQYLTEDAGGPNAIWVTGATSCTQLTDSPAITVNFDLPAIGGGTTVNLSSTNVSDVFKNTGGGSTETSLVVTAGQSTGSFVLNPATNALRTLTAAATGVTSGTLVFDAGVGLPLDVNALTSGNLSASATPGALNSLGLVDLTGSFYGIAANLFTPNNGPNQSSNWLLDSLDGVAQDGGVAFYTAAFANACFYPVLRGDLNLNGYSIQVTTTGITVSKVIATTATVLGTASFSANMTASSSVWVDLKVVGLGALATITARWFPGNSGTIPDFVGATPSGTAVYTDVAASLPSTRGGYFGLGGPMTNIGRINIRKIASSSGSHLPIGLLFNRQPLGV